MRYTNLICEIKDKKMKKGWRRGLQVNTEEKYMNEQGKKKFNATGAYPSLCMMSQKGGGGLHI